MRVQILPSDTSGSPGIENAYAATILINDQVALDAGCLGFHGDTERQSAVEHVFLSHAHLDHTASLPMFLENTFSNTAACATVYATDEVHQWLQEHMFNDRLWPDFVHLSTPESKLINRVSLVPGTPVEVAGQSSSAPVQAVATSPATTCVGTVNGSGGVEPPGIWQLRVYFSNSSYSGSFTGWGLRFQSLGTNDCNDNDIPDDCDIANGTAFDCNGNGLLDSCDALDGTAFDCWHRVWTAATEDIHPHAGDRLVPS